MEITGLKFDVHVSDYEEDLTLPLKPGELAKHISLKKAETVAVKYEDSVIIAADTFIVFNDNLLGKPHTPERAEEMLLMLSGEKHRVITGFTIIDSKSGNIFSQSVSTKVYFRKIDSREIKAYINTKEPLDKAGAYAIQGMGALFVEKIKGDFFNVVGLPLCELSKNLGEFGIDILTTCA